MEQHAIGYVANIIAACIDAILKQKANQLKHELVLFAKQNRHN